MRVLWMLPALLLLVACAGQPACMTDQPYKHAEAFPPLRAPAGMNVPEPDPNLQVPEVEDGPVGAFPAEEGESGEAALERCLATPPRLPAEPK